jgi:hypothetical protein
MAWWHPEWFNRVLTYSGTYVNQVPANSPYPHGCWVYHDVDPYNAAAANGLIVQAAVSKPLRVWLESAQNDIGAGSGPYNDFRLASQRMALALAMKGYHYEYNYAQGAGHADGNVIAQTLPSALLYLWRGWPIQ